MKTGTALGAAALIGGSGALAERLPLPLGLQLFSVRDYLRKDFAGTLKDLGELGYREVESAGYFDRTAAQVRQAMESAGLKLVSAHYAYNDLDPKLEEILEFHHELGVNYLICSFPGFKDPSRVKNMSYQERSRAFTLDDWKWNAERFNSIGEKVHAAGMRFGYHNHALEFRPVEGTLPYTVLLQLTDPAKVTMEMDCGWVVAGGADPVEYLRKYPQRFSMLHVKDFRFDKSAAPGSAEPEVKELGQGEIDYRPLFAEVAKGGQIKHIFVEQEAFDMPWKESLKVDAAYMRKLGAA